MAAETFVGSTFHCPRTVTRAYSHFRRRVNVEHRVERLEFEAAVGMWDSVAVNGRRVDAPRSTGSIFANDGVQSDATNPLLDRIPTQRFDRGDGIQFESEFEGFRIAVRREAASVLLAEAEPRIEIQGRLHLDGRVEKIDFLELPGKRRHGEVVLRAKQARGFRVGQQSVELFDGQQPMQRVAGIQMQESLFAGQFRWRFTIRTAKPVMKGFAKKVGRHALEETARHEVGFVIRPQHFLRVGHTADLPGAWMR